MTELSLLSEELKALRKQALKGQLFDDSQRVLLETALQAEDPAIRLLVFRFTEAFIRRLPFSPSLAAYQPQVSVLAKLLLIGLGDKLALIRKAAMNDLDRLHFVFDRAAGSPATVFGEDALSLLAPQLADSGCDLDAQNLPVQPKGTLTISERAYYLIAAYPKKTDFAPVYRALIPALERLHVLISNGWIDARQGSKLIDRLLSMFDLLILTKQAPFPSEPQGSSGPDYVTGLLVFCNDPAYHAIPDHAILKLQRLLVESSRHTGQLVAALAAQDDPLCRETVLRLLAQKLEQGQQLDDFRPRLSELLTAHELQELTGAIR